MSIVEQLKMALADALKHISEQIAAIDQYKTETEKLKPQIDNAVAGASNQFAINMRIQIGQTPEQLEKAIQNLKRAHETLENIMRTL